MHHRIRPVLVTLAALTLIGGAACSDDDDDTSTSAGTSGDGAGASTVQVDDNVFEPEEITVSTGDTVTWEWVGSEPHNVVGDDFESEMQTEGTFEHTFDTEGTFDYVCQVHPGMEGVVEVTA
jgi:plastocyanin